MKKNVLMLAMLLAAASVCATDQKKDEKKSSSAQVVDSGTFGIFMGGKRIGTESFRIEQAADVGTITAEIKVTDGASRSEQSSEMQVGRDGNLRSYKWHASIPDKEEAVVEPRDQLLVEHLTPADQKRHDVPHVLPLSTVILDDFFFSHRELLAWRYLATGCLPHDGHLECNPSQFGVLIPHQHTAGTVIVELMGRDKIMFKGTEQELNKLRLDADGVQWLLWVDDQENHYKVLKMSIPANRVEVIRD